MKTKYIDQLKEPPEYTVTGFLALLVFLLSKYVFLSMHKFCQNACGEAILDSAKELMTRESTPGLSLWSWIAER
jgi:hypothetical protein